VKGVADSYFHAYEVGKFYRVPCIKTTKRCSYGHGAFVPIIGPEHADAEFLNFPHSHWHIDWRFASAQVFSRAHWGHLRPSSHVYAVVLQRWAWGSPLYNHAFIEGDVVMKRMKCKRVLPPYPFKDAKWLPKLEAAFASARMTGMVCPHKGLPLEGCPLDGDVVQCPGHGLRWNIKTGELVTSPCATNSPMKGA
jgi:hypothetical protein